MSSLGLQPMRGNMQGADVSRVLDVPRVRVYRNAGLSILTGTNTSVIWDSVDYDTDGMWSPTINPTRLTCRTQGLYLVVADVNWAFNTNGVRQIQVQKNNTTNYLLGQILPNSGGFSDQQQVAQFVDLKAGDYIEVLVVQNSASSLVVAGATPTAHTNGFQACLIST